MLDALKLYSVKQRIYLNTLILIFKIQNNMVPGYMNEDNFTERWWLQIAPHTRKHQRKTPWYEGLKLFIELEAAIQQEIVLDSLDSEVRKRERFFQGAFQEISREEMSGEEMA
jgi:hypothetical protein